MNLTIYFISLCLPNKSKVHNLTMKVFFLSNKNSCRSQIAEAILKNFDKSLEIYSAGIEPADHISKVAIEVLGEIGINLDSAKPVHYSAFKEIYFDYLITVGDGTNEELNIPPINYKHKLHLGIHNPYKRFRDSEELKEKCREIREEIYLELDYFYQKMIKKTPAN